ncbi:MAG TPA: MBL fold metallo-hydrolase, partial [Sedimentisphaerales bacterium]|nr:MBL fold metallo-hydrolase [Sedimentisphaerales bacterium]
NNAMPSHRLAKIEIEDLEITGYSIAGEETVIAMPQLDVCFDIGKAPDQVISINNVLLTHGHMDHAAGLAYYLSHRNFCGISAGTIIAPADLIKPIKQIIDAWGKLDGNEVPANLIGVTPGDEIEIKPNLFARVFPVKHSRGSVGYTIIEKRKKIKSEYAGLNGPQIVELKKQGIVIDNPIELPIVTYLGDSQYIDYSSLEYVAKSKILITECTFFEDDHIERAKAGRHIHINHFAELLENLDNDHIVLIHTTQRTPLRMVHKKLKEALPAATYKKVIVLMDDKNLQ